MGISDIPTSLLARSRAAARDEEPEAPEREMIESMGVERLLWCWEGEKGQGGLDIYSEAEMPTMLRPLPPP